MLVVENISKRFADIPALDNINLEINTGEVTAIIGENGAGKSTLMKILSGVYPDYEGKILYKGKEVRFSNPRQAQEHAQNGIFGLRRKKVRSRNKAGIFGESLED